MKKTATILTALLLSACLCLSSACGSEEEKTSTSTSSSVPSQTPPVEPEKESALVLTSSSVDMQTKEAIFYAGEEYTFSVGFGADTLENVDVSCVIVNLTGDGLSYEIKQKKIVVSAPNATTGKISVKATIEGKEYTSQEYDIQVVAIDRVRTNVTAYSLLSKEDLSGGVVAAANTTGKIEMYRFNNAQGEQVITSEASFVSSDPTIVSVDESGTLSSVSSGSATITCTYGKERVEIGVDVYVPIYTADDMDTLALCTYYEDEATATKLLSQNYVLMNDVDYGSHERNYILPIASPTIEDIYATVSRQFSVAGDCSYFSYAWKNILGLTQKVGEKGEQYLEKADGTPFKGINPNAVKFTGVFDGNGYSFRNAWLMLDNVLFLNGISTQNTGYTAGANCFIGYNQGILQNLSFIDFTIGNSHDQLYTPNQDGVLENKYSYFNNSMWANWQDDNNRKKMQNAMTIAYRSGSFPGTAVSQGTTYKSEIFGTVDTAGYKGLQTYGGDELPSGRTMWGTRPNSASALVFINEGKVENLYLEYFQSANQGLGLNSSIFAVQNEGQVRNSVAIVEVDLSEARPETIYYSGAVVNNGLLENIAVAIEVYKRTDYAMFNPNANTGSVISCVSYLDKADFMENAKNLDKYDGSIWEKDSMILQQNIYGFVR